MDWEHEAGHKCPAEIKAFFEDIEPCLAILHADAVTMSSPSTQNAGTEKHKNILLFRKVRVMQNSRRVKSGSNSNHSLFFPLSFSVWYC